MDSNIPFKLNVGHFRRKKLLEAIIDKKDRGLKILQAFKR